MKNKSRISDYRRAMIEAKVYPSSVKVPIFKTSNDAIKFVLALVPGTGVLDKVIDPETAEIYMRPGDFAPNRKLDPLSVRYIEINGWNPYDYTASFERLYDVTKEDYEATADKSELGPVHGHNIGTKVPIKIMRPDGEAFSSDDIGNIQEYIDWMNGYGPNGPIEPSDLMLPPNVELACRAHLGEFEAYVEVLIKA
jgi:hypothetical protein